MIAGTCGVNSPGLLCATPTPITSTGDAKNDYSMQQLQKKSYLVFSQIRFFQMLIPVANFLVGPYRRNFGPSVRGPPA